MPKSPHNWFKFITMTVVCSCAIATWWWKTHPSTPVQTKTIVMQVKQGDGYLTETQCREIKRGTKRETLRQEYGVPADYDQWDDDDSWSYPLREDHGRQCTVYISNWYGPFRKGMRVSGVTLDIVEREY
jgi:hypothetical protein